MLVVDHYHYLPGSCTLCRSSNLPTVDTNVDLDWPNTPDEPNPSANRRLYICADCCINLADMVKHSRGLEIKPAQNYQLLEELSQQLATRNTALANRVNDLESALSVVNSINQTSIVVEETPAVDTSEYRVVPPPKGKK